MESDPAVAPFNEWQQKSDYSLSFNNVCSNCCAPVEPVANSEEVGSNPEPSVISKFYNTLYSEELFIPEVVISEKKPTLTPEHNREIYVDGDKYHIHTSLYQLYRYRTENDWDEDLCLCSPCYNVLVELFQLFLKFEKLRSLGSYVFKKLQSYRWEDEDYQGRVVANHFLDDSATNTPVADAVCDNNDNRDYSQGSPLSMHSGCDDSQQKDPKLEPSYKGPWVLLSKIEVTPPRTKRTFRRGTKLTIRGLKSQKRGSNARAKNGKQIMGKNSTKKKKIKKECEENPEKRLKPEMKPSSLPPGFVKLHKTYRRRRTKFANPCWFCPEHFDTLDLCKAHTQEMHADQGSFLCDLCSRLLQTDTALSLHTAFCKQNYTPGEKLTTFQCPHCFKNLESQPCLNVHLQFHQPKTGFPCQHPDCKFSTKTQTLLDHHVRNIHPEPGADPVGPFPCDVCGKFSKTQATLKAHKSNLHSEQGISLYKERLIASRAKDKERRLKRRLARPERSYICPECGVDNYNSQRHSFHMKTFHGSVMKYVCDQCGASLSSRAGLNKHVETVHSEARPFICEHCGKGFKTSPNLRYHDRHTHSEEGRLEYNEKMRLHNQRRKLVAQAMARVGVGKSMDQRKRAIGSVGYIEDDSDSNSMDVLNS